MAATQAQLDALEKAIFSGSRDVYFEDRRVSFRSLADMLALRRQLQSELGIANERRVIRSVYDKGLG